MEEEFSPLLRWFDPLGKEEEVEGEFSLPLRWFDPLVPTPFVSRFRQPAKETGGLWSGEAKRGLWITEAV